jgi:hypothetical protein
MNILGIVILFCVICGAIYEGVSIISDTLRVNSIEQKALSGDVPNATREVGQFVTDKTTDYAYGAVAGAILTVIGEVVGVFVGIIFGIVAFIKGLGF